MKQIKKVLILGSGALKIGEAGEFDYSGSQAIKALKEEGIKTVLVNPNIATIQTSRFLADTVYFLPTDDYFVEKIIEKEKPDGIFLSFGGQTALNCGIELHKKNILKKHDVEILGSPISAIMLTEDRRKFAKHLEKIGIPTPHSKTAHTVKQALEIANEISYPVMVRSGFALGGQGSGIARNNKELENIVEHALAFGSQILIEQYLHHFKEIEYEVVRDKDDNCIAVCNMENMDPLGIHTGESIVVAPSQTLNNFEYHSLRSAAIKIVRSLKIVGECNVQFALNPNPAEVSNGEKNSFEFYTIEVNARLSRSSALASKATGYPLAYVAGKLALGKNLTEIKNKVTQVTQSCFEPALDYIVVKMPRWDIEKFKGADEQIGTSMKSVGEVMGIGRTFEEAYQKAIRMLDLDLEGATNKLILKNEMHLSMQHIKDALKNPTPKRIFAIAEAFRRNITIEQLHTLTGIDPWFLSRIKQIVSEEEDLKNISIENLSASKLLSLKRLGFSDRRIGETLNVLGLDIRKLRKKYNILPAFLQIDTLAGEFPAKTNYLYSTYNAHHHDIKALGKKAVIVLGSGPYRIGSSVEFDWTTVNTALAFKKHNKKSIMINCNPETVSTDYDISDRLYFEELTFERIADIYEFENPYGVIISVGGQTPNNRAGSLRQQGFTILGTDSHIIDRAENRTKFSKLLDELEIAQPAWSKFTDIDTALKFSDKVGFPVLIRPSFVLSGTLMRICRNSNELRLFIKEAAHVSKEHPITVSKFIENAKEIEFDAVAQKGEIKAAIISEHIENAGVHSGDASIVLPPQKIYVETAKKIEEIARKLAEALIITGPFNIQFLAKDNEISVIEINLRASRTFPFIVKVTGIDLIGISVDGFFNKKINKISKTALNFVAAKVPQFSFARLTGADPVLHVEMSSTGEAACFGENLEEAFLKGVLATGGKIPKKGVYLSLGKENKNLFLESAEKLRKIGLPIFATEKTAEFLNEHGIKAKLLHKISTKKSPSVLEYLAKGKIDLAINIPVEYNRQEVEDGYKIRRFAIDHNIALFTNRQKAELFIKAISENNLNSLLIKSWDEYVIQHIS